MEGHLAGTQWGEDFLLADVALKQYCLKLLSGFWPVRSYRDFFEDEIRAQAQAAGTRVTQIEWAQGAAGQWVVQAHQDQGVVISNFSQCRFWFYPTQQQRPVYQDEVYCIKELHLGVQPEVLGQAGPGSPESPGARFAQSFSDSMEVVSKQAPLARLKGLYDLVAVAEAIRSEGLTNLVAKLMDVYEPKTVATPTNYPLQELIGIVQREDNVQELVCLAGGIDFHTEIKHLQHGDVTPLRTIVLKTRPNPRTLAWELPLGSWVIPNLGQADAAMPDMVQSSREVPGCVISEQLAFFQKPGQPLAPATLKFTSFQAVSPVAEPAFKLDYADGLSASRGGVSMMMDDLAGHTNSELHGLKERLLHSRSNTNAVSSDLN